MRDTFWTARGAAGVATDMGLRGPGRKFRVVRRGKNAVVVVEIETFFRDHHLQPIFQPHFKFYLLEQ